MFDDDCVNCYETPTMDPYMPDRHCRLLADTTVDSCIGTMNCINYIPASTATDASNGTTNRTTKTRDRKGITYSVPSYDVISRPSHYAEGRKYEPKDVIRDWNLNFNLGNAVKYVARAGRKDDILQDLKKARQYLDFEIEYLENEREEK